MTPALVAGISQTLASYLSTQRPPTWTESSGHFFACTGAATSSTSMDADAAPDNFVIVVPPGCSTKASRGESPWAIACWLDGRQAKFDRTVAQRRRSAALSGERGAARRGARRSL